MITDAYSIDYKTKKGRAFDQGVYTNWPGFKMMWTQCSHFLSQIIAWENHIVAYIGINIMYMQNNLPSMKNNN